MVDKDLISKSYEIGDKHKVILKGNITISRDTNCILFGHYCKSTLFYKDFLNVSKDIARVNKVAKKNLKEIKELIKSHGYEKIWSKGVFSFYGDLRPLAVEAGLGEWSQNGLVESEKYGTDFLITAIFYR